MWLPFGLHRIEKPGQGLRARWFTFALLMLLLGWGSYSVYDAIYVGFGWHEEIPDLVEFDYTRAHLSPVPGTYARYGISAKDGTLVEIIDAAQIAATEKTDSPITQATEGGIPLDAAHIEILLKPDVVLPEGQSTRNLTLAQAAARQGKPVVTSGPGTDLTIRIRHPAVPDDAPDAEKFVSLDGPMQYILPPGVGICPRSGIQINGTGWPWATVIALGSLLLAGLISWKTCFGSWASNVLIETDIELNKVNWPTRETVFNSSVVVVLVTIVFAVLLFAADMLLKLLIKDWLSLW